MAKKHYVLDTNILLQSPRAIFGFDDNNVYITSTTLQELDGKKTAVGEVGYAARETARILNELIEIGDITAGVPINEVGAFKILTDGISQSNLIEGYDISRADNKIISACVALQKELNESSKNEEQVILVSNDTLMRINAWANGLPAEVYENNHLQNNENYKGIEVVEIEDWTIIDKIFNDEPVNFIPEIENPLINEFFVLKSGNKSCLAMYRDGIYKNIKDQRAMRIKALNYAQDFALKALLAPPEEIPLVILKGSAGTAKTLLALAAGLEHTYDSKKVARYSQIYITRANQLADADFGYLPGDIADKMQELINPFTDNLEVILRGNSKEDNKEIQMQITDLFDTQIIRLLPLSYIRGRSISNSYVILDEAQNCSVQLIKDVVTRIGQGSKLVILGDPSQCDNHILDSRNNGLVYLAEKMKDSKYVAQITFDESQSVRSALATEALQRLN